MVQMVVGDSPCVSGEKSTRREYLILMWIKGSNILARLIQRGLVESVEFPISWENITVFLTVLVYICAIYFMFLHS
jgi:hypothetical protein